MKPPELNSNPAQIKHWLKQNVYSVLPKAELALTPIDNTPISLWLLDESFPQHRLSDEQKYRLMDTPPYWVFCWASGAVLAKLLLDTPSLVKGKRVFDFGAGSGIGAIAAMLAGATSAVVIDSDPLALRACALNAAANDVALEYASAFSDAQQGDVILVADVFYDRDNLPLLKAMQNQFVDVLVTDSRLKGAELEGMVLISQHDSHTVPDMAESIEFNTVCFYKKA